MLLFSYPSSVDLDTADSISAFSFDRQATISAVRMDDMHQQPYHYASSDDGLDSTVHNNNLQHLHHQTYDDFDSFNVSTAQHVVDISDGDVLLGRGKSNVKHPGNLRFQSIINSNTERYFEVSTHQEKKEITEEIVREIQRTGRFLKPNKSSNTWLLIEGEAARIKVAQALQYRQRRSSRQMSDDSSEKKGRSSTSSGVSTKVKDLTYKSNNKKRPSSFPLTQPLAKRQSPELRGAVSSSLPAPARQLPDAQVSFPDDYIMHQQSTVPPALGESSNTMTSSGFTGSARRFHDHNQQQEVQAQSSPITADDYRFVFGLDNLSVRSSAPTSDNSLGAAAQQLQHQQQQQHHQRQHQKTQETFSMQEIDNFVQERIRQTDYEVLPPNMNSTTNGFTQSQQNQQLDDQSSRRSSLEGAYQLLSVPSTSFLPQVMEERRAQHIGGNTFNQSSYQGDAHLSHAPNSAFQSNVYHQGGPYQVMSNNYNAHFSNNNVGEVNQSMRQYRVNQFNGDQQQYGRSFQQQSHLQFEALPDEEVYRAMNNGTQQRNQQNLLDEIESDHIFFQC